jgi:hypothetical protein
VARAYLTEPRISAPPKRAAGCTAMPRQVNLSRFVVRESRQPLIPRTKNCP